MIDVMALRQSNEKREITEIRWIDGKSNPADAITKGTPNRALQQFVDDNQLRVKMKLSMLQPSAPDLSALELATFYLSMII
jgi:hypothetical protein